MPIFIAVVALAELGGLEYVSCSTSLEKSTEYHRSVHLLYMYVCTQRCDFVLYFVVPGIQMRVVMQDSTFTHTHTHLHAHTLACTHPHV